MIHETAAWQALADHAESFASVHLRDLFADDPDRADRLSIELDGLLIDASKTHLTRETRRLLLDLAETAGLGDAIRAMFSGARVNPTEDRPALHTALRAPADRTIETDGGDVVPAVHRVRERMRAFARQVRGGERTGATGEAFETVVNIGIGGSDLGPRMAARALAHRVDGPVPRFVSNVDGCDLDDTLRACDPATTLFVVCSKSFTTLETLTNARTARGWLTDALGGDAVADHFVAVSTNREGVAEFGIDADRMFGFWDWVGGRYSLPSAVGLPLMLAVGPDDFASLLAGQHAVDEHFRTAEAADNAPVLLGLLAVWYRSFLGAATRAVLPYSDRLALLPAYLQQLEMESNGKRVTRDGEPVADATGPVVWGQPGTDGQHAFFQLLHQGTELVPADLVGVCSPPAGPDGAAVGVDRLGHHHDLLVANLIAQSEALAFGRDAAEVRGAGVPEPLVPHRTFPGNRPTTTILLDELTPFRLGQLIALYEHSVLTQAVVWDINPFDQWGVELGKELAGTVTDELTADDPTPGAHDPSTAGLIRHYRDRR